MTDQPEDLAAIDDARVIEAASTIDDAPRPPERSADLVVPEPVRWAVSPRQWAGLDAARTRLAELASHPVVIATATATATVGTGVVVSVLRHALRNDAHNGAATPVTVTLNVVQQSQVVHHVVHHVARPVIMPGTYISPLP